MAREKSNMLRELDQKSKELVNDPSLFAQSALTQPGEINAMRGLMFCTHTKQFLVLKDPEVPLYMTGAENVVGRHSTGYKKLKHKSKLVKIVKRFNGLLKAPFYGTYFFEDCETGMIRAIPRKEVEDLTETFGYKYNNEVIDSLREGDIVDAGTVLYKSTSYDEDMNYRYGKNARVLYCLDAQTTEDAAVVSASFAKSLVSYKVHKIKIPLNDNHFLVNCYGDENHYQPLPRVGERVKNRVLCSKRSLVTNQVLHDFKNSSLQEINWNSDDVYYVEDGVVTDISIYCNNENLQTNSFNSQLVEYFDSETNYWEQILDMCKKVYKSKGKKVDKEINHLYNRASTYLDTEKKWKEGDGVFSNMVIEVQIVTEVPAHVGQKITMRYGNKAVISEIRPDFLMPRMEDGTCIDILYNIAGVINRTTSSPLLEESVTFICERIAQHCMTMKSRKEQAALIFDVLNMFNEEECEQMKKVYSKLDSDGKDEFIRSCIEDGIHVVKRPLGTGKPMFMRLRDIYAKYGDILQPHKLYVYKYGRWVECMRPVYVGKQYVIKLKQDARKGFIGRNTGEIGMESLPEKSRSHKNGTTETSENTVRFGEFETYSLKGGIPSHDLAEFWAVYRTSIKGRRDMVEYLLSDDDVFKFDKSYNSRVNEIMGVFLKSLGIEIKFFDKMDKIKEYDDDVIRTYRVGDETYLCTEWDFYKISLRKDIENEVLERMVIVDIDVLKKTVDEIYEERMKNISA